MTDETTPANGNGMPWLRSYAPHVPEIAPIPDETLSHMFSSACLRFADAVALEFFGREVTYRELDRQVRLAAAGLRRLGVRPGDRVALVMPNCPQHVVAFYAVLRVGGVVVEQNPQYTAEELRVTFADHGARIAIAWNGICDVLDSLRATTDLETIVAVDLADALPAVKRLALRLPVSSARASRKALGRAPRVPTIPWRDLRRRGSNQLMLPDPDVVPDDVAIIQYTSGTSGTPKGVMLTHRNLRANAAQGRAWVPGLREGSEVFYGILPLFHVYGLTFCLTFALSIGARLVLFPKFDAESVVAEMHHHPATFLPAVPPIYERLVRSAEQGRIDLHSIRFAISGAMSLSPALVERWERSSGGWLVEGYGMTEASPIISGNPIAPSRRAGSVGIPFPGTVVRVVDPSDPSRECLPGEAGEMIVAGPQVFPGYWNRAEETAQTLLPGGWLRTGDVAIMDADGFLTIVDRLKELIVTGGFNVSPSEVEQVVLSSPGVAAVAVVGLPRRGGGEDVAAAVQMHPGAAFDAGAIRDFLKSRLVGYKVPKRIVEVTELPRSMMGKVLRRFVREQVFAS